MTNKRSANSRTILALSIALILFFSGCAKTPQALRYDVETEETVIWPLPPEQPRFQYVGELTGETNFQDATDDKSFTESMGDFFRWLVGLGSPGAKPRVLQRPQTGAIDANGRVLVTDVSRRSVMVFNGAEGKLDEWKMATGELEFHTPVGIAVGENGRIYVADAQRGFVVILNEKGDPVGQFGNDALKRPTGLARDADRKQLYVADTHSHDIKIFNDDGELLDVIGRQGVASGEFNSPTHLAFANGNLYVTDTFNTRVQVLTRDGDVSHEFGRRGLYVGNLIRPKGVTTDSEGNIYVIESYADYLLVYNAKGEFLLPIGGTGAGIGQFYLPSGVWSDDNDRIYIADMFNGRIVVLQYMGGRGAKQVTPISLK